MQSPSSPLPSLPQSPPLSLQNGISTQNTNNNPKEKKPKRTVVLLFSPPLMHHASLLPSNPNRAKLLYSLLHAFSLLKPLETEESVLRILKPQLAGREELAGFHEAEYVGWVLGDQVLAAAGEGKVEGEEGRVLGPGGRKRKRACYEAADAGGAARERPGPAQQRDVEQLDALGLVDDSPPFPTLPSYVRLVAGATLTAAEALRRGVAQHAVSWEGGRHHARRGGAAGFCYVGDVVLGVQRLRAPLEMVEVEREGEEEEVVEDEGVREGDVDERGGEGADGELKGNGTREDGKRNSTGARARRRARVMYLDLDVHYGDGVLEAFSPSRGGTLCISVHHSAPGFYPPSPHSGLTPADTADPYTVSLPLARGAGNGSYVRVWAGVERLQKAYDPDYVVVQCGLDALAGDPCRVFNLSLDRREEGSMGWMCERVVRWGKRTLWLGGGGYEAANAARAWTYLTGIIVGKPIEVTADIPDHALFDQYGPSFTLDVPAGTMRDKNTSEGLERVVGVAYALAERIERMRSG